MNVIEMWRSISGYESYYEVSNLGRVRSLDRELLNGRGYYLKKGRVLKQRINRLGRQTVMLNTDKKSYNKYPHILVAEAFIGERPEGYQVCHIDGNCFNNKLSNLRYDTRAQNQIDEYRQGKKSSRGKLSIDEVLEIRRLYATGEYKQKELAEKFNILPGNISRIVNRKYFSWLNDDGTIEESKTAVS